MSSTYSSNLRLELIASGEQANTWGNTTNTNLGTLIEEALTGIVEIDISASNKTLTALNGAFDQARAMVIVATGSAGVTRSIITPANVSKVYIVDNSASSDIEIVTAASGSPVSVAIPAGTAKFVYTDGTDFFEGNNAADAFTANTITADTVTISGTPTASTDAITVGYANSFNVSVSGTSGNTSAASGLVKTGSLTLGTLNLTLAPATSTNLGGVKPNATQFSVAADGAMTLNPPSGSSIGGVKAGTNITIAGDGTISASGGATGVASIAVTSPIQNTGTATNVALSMVADAYYPYTANPANYVTSAALSGYATTSYVNSALSSYVAKSGSSMTGPLSVSASYPSNNLINANNSGSSGVGVYGFGNAWGLEGASTGGYGLRGSSISSYGCSITTQNSSFSGGYFANNGSFISTFIATSSYAIQSGSAINVGGSVFPSDARLKESVATIQSGLATIAALNPVSFSWKADTYKGKKAGAPVPDYGFIAQEVEQVLNNVVYESSAPPIGPNDDEREKTLEDELGVIKGLDYTKIIPFLTAAIQELDAKVVALSAEVEALRDSPTS
jgi:hypothetical protein